VSARVAARGRPVAAWLVPGLAIAVWLAAEVLVFLPSGGHRAAPVYYAVYAIPYVAFAAVGGLIIRAHRASRVGWVLGGIGLLQGLAVLSAQVLRFVAAAPGGREAAGWLMVALTPVPVASMLLIVVLLLVFPDGRLPSPRWRWFLAALGVVVAGVLVSQVTSPLPSEDPPGLPVSPLADRAVFDAVAPLASFWLFAIAVLVAGGSLVLRYRAGGPVTRAQLKWLALAAVVLALCEAGNAALGQDGVLSGLLDALGKLAIAAAIGIAVLRHRLYDVDRAISRALAYGWLAVLVTGIYVLLVVGVGSALGHPAGPDLLLSLVATIVVALVSLPLRSRLQEGANRLVYGRRQAPYDSLAGFTRQLAERSEDGDPVPGIAQALGEGLRARAAAVHLLDAEDGVVGAWPPGTALPATAPTGAAPVTYQGEHLGRLEVWTDDELTDAEQRLLEDLAHQAGLVVRNAALSTELEHRLLELRASRLRLVAAQDAERRRFERDLHDGAQQELLTARMKLGSAERLAADRAPEIAELLREVHESTAATLDSIRRLSRGLNPPLLQSHGLVAALVAHARRLPLPTEVSGSGGRFPADVETAVYFCCAEALQNVVKHADARRAWVTVTADADLLCFEVGDDGRGLGTRAPASGSGLQNMADRLEALGGRLDLRWNARGTCVVGTVPVPRTSDTPERTGLIER
jgi:signal transduction histidine kinase